MVLVINEQAIFHNLKHEMQITQTWIVLRRVFRYLAGLAILDFSDLSRRTI